MAAMNVQNVLGQPIRLVEQQALPDGMTYEAFIHDTGQVPTRNNLHDFFNALVWLSFPHIKGQLNNLQVTQIKRDGINAVRGSVRDAATVFDENTALVVIRDNDLGSQLLESLRNHEWRRLFILQREEFLQYCDVWLFGHALMEKLADPYKAITAHAWALAASDEYFSMNDMNQQRWLDRQVALQLQQYRDGGLTTSHFTPLPILGVPGWWQGQDELFYADEQVFRPKRRQG